MWLVSAGDIHQGSPWSTCMGYVCVANSADSKVSVIYPLFVFQRQGLSSEGVLGLYFPDGKLRAFWCWFCELWCSLKLSFHSVFYNLCMCCGTYSLQKLPLILEIKLSRGHKRVRERLCSLNAPLFLKQRLSLPPLRWDLTMLWRLALNSQSSWLSMPSISVTGKHPSLIWESL